MANSSSALRKWLAGQHWLECPLALRSTFAGQARQHPLIVLDALLKYSSHQGRQPWPAWLFRPGSNFGARIQQGQAYALRLLFPSCTDVAIGEEAATGLRAWLDGEKRHFSLDEAEAPAVLSGADALSLLLEAEPGLATTNSATINVFTPIPFKSAAGWKGAATAEWLGETLLRRAERLFGPMAQEVREEALLDWKELRLVPWFWDYEEHQHRSKSTGGTRYLNGFCGRLFLEGDLEPALPLLALGARCNAGSRLSAGQGAFGVAVEASALEADLFSEETWMRAWRRLARITPGLAPDLPEGMFGRLCALRLEPDGQTAWKDAGMVDRLLGMGLHCLLARPLARMEPELQSYWRESLPWLPAGLDVPSAARRLLPGADRAVLATLERFARLERSADAGRTQQEEPPEASGSAQAQEAGDAGGGGSGGTPLRRPCYLLRTGAAAGLCDGKVCSRYRGETVGSVPLGHVSVLVLQGAGSVSVPLIRACGERDIPVVLCSASGRYQSMIPPEGATWRDRADCQLRHWDALGEEGRQAAGIAFVTAKVRTYLAWLGCAGDAPPRLQKAGAAALAGLAQATGREQALGIEGSFARLCFGAVNRLVAGRGFASPRREPRRRLDAWNCLLDVASSLVYSRLCVLLQGEGLSPYRGFMHCQHGRFATLAADVQELFRARTERWLTAMVLDGRVDETWLERSGDGDAWSLSEDAWPRMLEQFEQELGRLRGGNGMTWLELMEEQTHRIRLWTAGKKELALYDGRGWWTPEHLDAGAPARLQATGSAPTAFPAWSPDRP